MALMNAGPERVGGIFQMPGYRVKDAGKSRKEEK